MTICIKRIQNQHCFMIILFTNLITMNIIHQKNCLQCPNRLLSLCLWSTSSSKASVHSLSYSCIYISPSCVGLKPSLRFVRFGFPDVNFSPAILLILTQTIGVNNNNSKSVLYHSMVHEGLQISEEWKKIDGDICNTLPQLFSKTTVSFIY